MKLPRPQGPHPTIEQLDRARRGPGCADSERVLGHVALCPACAEEEIRLAAFDAPEALSERKLATEWARFGQPVAARRAVPAARWIGLAAVLALGTSAGLFFVARRQPVDEIRGPARLVAGPEGLLDSPPREFPVPSGDRVIVFDAGRSYEWTSVPAIGATVPFPEVERRKLRPAVDYYWTIVGDGSTPARRFRIR